MFTKQFTKYSRGFVHTLQCGFVTAHPEVKYCIVDFDPEHYNDRLFDSLAIQLPLALKQSCIKRKAEYLAVRYAAKGILSMAGCKHIPGTAMDRSPVWPVGWCGSLSHSNNSAIALIASEAIGVMPGVDLEFLRKNEILGVAGLLARDEELALIKHTNIDYENGLYLLFSIKESLFKSLYPELGERKAGFKDVRVIGIDTISWDVTLELTKTLSLYYVEGFQITGKYIIDTNMIITLVL